MSETVTGAALVALPTLFNIGFTLLNMRFDYPDVLREPTQEVLRRYREGGTSLILIWWAFALSAVLLAPVVVLLAGELGDADRTIVALSVVFGVLASAVQFLGRFEPSGWKLAGQLTPVAYILWSLWLAAIGVAFLV
jgi:hypothetical protein